MYLVLVLAAESKKEKKEWRKVNWTKRALFDLCSNDVYIVVEIGRMDAKTSVQRIWLTHSKKRVFGQKLHRWSSDHSQISSKELRTDQRIDTKIRRTQFISTIKMGKWGNLRKNEICVTLCYFVWKWIIGIWNNLQSIDVIFAFKICSQLSHTTVSEMFPKLRSICRQETKFKRLWKWLAPE